MTEVGEGATISLERGIVSIRRRVSGVTLCPLHTRAVLSADRTAKISVSQNVSIIPSAVQKAAALAALTHTHRASPSVWGHACKKKARDSCRLTKSTSVSKRLSTTLKTHNGWPTLGRNERGLLHSHHWAASNLNSRRIPRTKALKSFELFKDSVSASIAGIVGSQRSTVREQPRHISWHTCYLERKGW